jgi:glycosyltransferase involved in cell wall biosynthesis
VISFVIPAYNEERYLGATLAALHEAMKDIGKRYEVIVADDSSTDHTATVAANGGARVVHSDRRQIAGTRNVGAKAAQGHTLVFVDADTRVNAEVIRGMIAAIESGAVAGGAGVQFDSAPAWANFIVKGLVPLFRTMRWAAGCFLFCTREAFDAVGGFDEAYFASEEIHMSRALGRKGRFVVLRGAVTTSGRKTEKYSLWASLGLMVRLLLGGLGSVKSRRATQDFWYDGKR